MSNYFFNLKYKVANKVSNYPGLYKMISKGLTGRDCYTTKDSDIVIDGHPRSANTYATYAFKIAQTKDLIIANHIHKKSQFLTAEKYGIPAILLIREPMDCIASMLIRQPKYDPTVLFDGYYFLYNGLKDSNAFVVGEFNEVINNYAEVIKRVNKRFDKNFDLYYKTEENEKLVKHIVQTQDELKGASDYDQRVAYPNETRKKVMNDVKKRLQQEIYKTDYSKCKKIYDHFMNKQ
ncbi:MAG: hypothetical protein JO072_03030 [Parafilimonas sp.]|nr:hypothetical protein [Parafilimonas sp.]